MDLGDFYNIRYILVYGLYFDVSARISYTVRYSQIRAYTRILIYRIFLVYAVYAV